MSTPFNPCVVIPVYNHVAVIGKLVALLDEKKLPVVLVDDGSDPPCRAVLEQLRSTFSQMHLSTHAHNRGKGAALKTGLLAAHRLGFTHAVQIDADGQHDTGDIDLFLEKSRAKPETLIAGCPVYDRSVPKIRFYCRYLSHVWVWINTLSLQIVDSMCGFRVYPLQKSCDLLQRKQMGNRMEFDGEFIVHWYWAGHALVQLPTKVIYPADGTSHFRLLRDNVLISWMHAKLFLLMLPQLPKLLARNVSRTREPRAGIR
ncbi:MAG: glycosyltransferase family 2 protein [Pseudomonadota bacterium]